MARRPTLLAKRYELQARLFSDGVQAAYRAFDRQRLDEVLLLWVPPSSKLSDSVDELLVEEITASANLNHEAVAPIYDVYDTPERRFLVMPVPRGDNLWELVTRKALKSRPYDVEACLRVANRLLEVAAATNRTGRAFGFHPRQVWLTREGEVEVHHFWLDRVAHSDDERAEHPHARRLAGEQTNFIAPEVRRGGRISPEAADQYFVASVVYALLSGDVPAGSLRPLHRIRSDVPRALSQAIAKATHDSPRSRHADVDEMRATLTRERPTIKPVLPWLVTLMMLVGTLLVANADARMDDWAIRGPKPRTRAAADMPVASEPDAWAPAPWPEMDEELQRIWAGLYAAEDETTLLFLSSNGAYQLDTLGETTWGRWAADGDGLELLAIAPGGPQRAAVRRDGGLALDDTAPPLRKRLWQTSAGLVPPVRLTVPSWADPHVLVVRGTPAPGVRIESVVPEVAHESEGGPFALEIPAVDGRYRAGIQIVADGFAYELGVDEPARRTAGVSEGFRPDWTPSGTMGTRALESGPLPDGRVTWALGTTLEIEPYERFLDGRRVELSARVLHAPPEARIRVRLEGSQQELAPPFRTASVEGGAGVLRASIQLTLPKAGTYVLVLEPLDADGEPLGVPTSAEVEVTDQSTFTSWAKGRAPTPAQVDASVAHGLDLTLTGPHGMQFILVPAIDGGRPFYVQRAVVSNMQWRAADRTSKKEEGYRDFLARYESRVGTKNIFSSEQKPVLNVTRSEAARLLRKLNTPPRDDGLAYRLPTMEEWFHYAQAGGDRRSPSTREANFADETIKRDVLGGWKGKYPREGTGDGTPCTWSQAPKANPWGLFDVLGNAAELTGDGKMRGGSWADPRTAAWDAQPPTKSSGSGDSRRPRRPQDGLRLVLAPREAGDD